MLRIVVCVCACMRGGLMLLQPSYCCFYSPSLSPSLAVLLPSYCCCYSPHIAAAAALALDGVALDGCRCFLATAALLRVHRWCAARHRGGCYSRLPSYSRLLSYRRLLDYSRLPPHCYRGSGPVEPGILVSRTAGCSSGCSVALTSSTGHGCSRGGRVLGEERRRQGHVRQGPWRGHGQGGAGDRQGRPHQARVLGEAGQGSSRAT